MLRCGGGANPASPSGTGVKLQGVVLQNAAGVASSASASARSATAGKIVVTVRENSSLSATVSSNGTFEIQNLPASGFTLIFSVNGVVVGQINITAVTEGTTIRIVVKLSDNDAELVDLETDEDNGTSGNQPKTCMINGGTMGHEIELEGTVDSGTSAQFKMRVNGNRSSGLVDVAASGASYKCNGDKGTAADCKAKLKAGVKVHVRGNLTACSTTAASVTATEVMIQKD